MVLRQRPSGRSYDIETPGGVFACNHQFLRPLDVGAGGNVDEDIEDLAPPVRRSPRLHKKTVRFTPDTL